MEQTFQKSLKCISVLVCVCAALPYADNQPHITFDFTTHEHLWCAVLRCLAVPAAARMRYVSLRIDTHLHQLHVYAQTQGLRSWRLRALEGAVRQYKCTQPPRLRLDGSALPCRRCPSQKVNNGYLKEAPSAHPSAWTQKRLRRLLGPRLSSTSSRTLSGC